MSAYENFLREHSIKKGDKTTPVTHTRIGDPKNNLFGGSYHIPDEKMEEFQMLYFNNIVKKNKNEYLTEIQHKNKNGILAIDIDFRFPYETTERYINKSHIDSFLLVLFEELMKVYE